MAALLSTSRRDVVMLPALLVVIMASTITTLRFGASGLAAVGGIVLAALSFVGPRIRLVTVVGGALAVFQSSGAGGVKYAYLAVAVLCAAISAANLRNQSREAAWAYRPLVSGTLVLFGTCLLGALVSESAGNSTSDIVRDSLPYVLLGVLPIVGVDVSRRLTAVAVNRAIGVLGVVSATAIATDWLARRGVGTLGIGRFLLSSNSVVALGFSLALTKALTARRGRQWWLLTSSYIIAAALVSGSRTNIVLLLAVFGVVGARSKARGSLKSAFGALAALGVIAFAFLQLVAPRFTANDPTFFSDRLHSAQNVLFGQASSDQSFVLRSQAYSYARQAFLAHPWFGTGPGHLYPDGSFTMDTPLISVAKWGLVGGLGLVAFGIAVFRCVHRCRLLSGWSPAHTAARAWVLVLFALIPFGSWLEDKGLALSITLLIAAAWPGRSYNGADGPTVSPEPSGGVIRRPSLSSV